VTEGAILDTGPLVAYLVERDDHHDWAVSTFSSFPPLFWTCESVLTEVAFLVDFDSRALRSIGAFLERGWLRVPFHFEKHHAQVLQLMEKYQSTPMSLADACIVRLAEMHDECPVITTDADFHIYRKFRSQPIKTILPPTPKRRRK
jgi:uncharacterized protein